MLRHKFHAVRNVRDGQNFDSKTEANYYDYLKELQEAGEIIGFLRHPVIHIEGGRYTADFQVFYPDGTLKFIDVKGAINDRFKRSIAQVKARYPWLEITIVRAKGKRWEEEVA